MVNTLVRMYALESTREAQISVRKYVHIQVYIIIYLISQQIELNSSKCMFAHVPEHVYKQTICTYGLWYNLSRIKSKQ